MIDIDTIKIGERIREKRLSLGLNQTAFLEKLKDVGVRDISHLSRIENGNITDKSLYVRICEKLDISTGDARLRIAFSQGFWAAPLVWINEYSATPDFFNHAALSAYTACEQSEMLIFNRKSERLPPFDAQKHDFFYSGEIADLLRDEKIDVGFLGSTVVDDKDFVRVARLVNANSVRHAMVVFTPKGKFKDANGKPDKRQIIEYLLQKPTTEAEACHVYYHPKSTAQNEYRELLQHADHWHNTLPVLDLPKFQKAFADKLKAHSGQIVAHIGLMLSVETAKKAAKDAFGNKLDVFTFRTADIIPIAEALIKAGKIDPAAFTPSDYYYEMVVRRSNERIKKLADDKGFQLLLKLLRGAVAQLAADRQAVGKVLSHRKVADFFGLDLEQASFMLKETAFELMFYPEWVNKVLGAI